MEHTHMYCMQYWHIFNLSIEPKHRSKAWRSHTCSHRVPRWEGGRPFWQLLGEAWFYFIFLTGTNTFSEGSWCSDRCQSTGMSLIVDSLSGGCHLMAMASHPTRSVSSWIHSRTGQIMSVHLRIDSSLLCAILMVQVFRPDNDGEVPSSYWNHCLFLKGVIVWKTQFPWFFISNMYPWTMNNPSKFKENLSTPSLFITVFRWSVPATGPFYCWRQQ